MFTVKPCILRCHACGCNFGSDCLCLPALLLTVGELIHFHVLIPLELRLPCMACITLYTLTFTYCFCQQSQKSYNKPVVGIYVCMYINNCYYNLSAFATLSDPWTAFGSNWNKSVVVHSWHYDDKLFIIFIWFNILYHFMESTFEHIHIWKNT